MGSEQPRIQPSERTAETTLAERSTVGGGPTGMETKHRLINPQTGNKVPLLSSQDGSVACMKIVPEVRTASPVLLSSADEEEEEDCLTHFAEGERRQHIDGRSEYRGAANRRYLVKRHRKQRLPDTSGGSYRKGDIQKFLRERFFTSAFSLETNQVKVVAQQDTSEEAQTTSQKNNTEHGVVNRKTIYRGGTMINSDICG